MRTLTMPFLLFAMICFFSFQSCKKGGSDPITPPPTPVLPDTLTAGWSKVVITGGGNLADVVFNSSTTGFAIGDGIFKSTDGGITWAKVQPSSQTNLSFSPDGKVFFVSATTNNITRSIDGGATVTSYPISDVLYDIMFVDNNNGYCIGANGIYNTTDAGVTWAKLTTTGAFFAANYSSLAFLNNTTGWICNGNGIFRSVGSASTWQQSIINGVSGNGIDCVFPTSASIIYAADTHGSCFKSTDGGANFNFIKAFGNSTAFGYCDLHFIDSQNGYACYGTHIYKTTNGGASWTTVVSMGQSSITELHFTDANHGWACGSSGEILLLR